MKKTLIILLLFSSSVFAEDISDFQIEGMSVGDSLLNYFSEDEIISEIKRTKSWYSDLPQESGFGEVYKFYGLDTYFMVSFMVKPDDDKYIIYSIRGSLPYEVDMSLCYKKMDEISKEFSVLFENAEKSENSYNHSIDPSGRSKVSDVVFKLQSGDEISIRCMDFEEKLRIKKDWIDGLHIGIYKKEVSDWLSQH